MSSVETGQMSAVETGQMSAAETGQMSAVETRQMYSIGTPEIKHVYFSDTIGKGCIQKKSATVVLGCIRDKT